MTTGLKTYIFSFLKLVCILGWRDREAELNYMQTMECIRELIQNPGEVSPINYKYI